MEESYFLLLAWELRSLLCCVFEQPRLLLLSPGENKGGKCMWEMKQSLEHTDSEYQPGPGLLLFQEENVLGRAGSSEKLALHQHPAVPFWPPAPTGPLSTERLGRSRRVLNSQGSNRACATCTDSTFRRHPGQEISVSWVCTDTLPDDMLRRRPKGGGL